MPRRKVGSKRQLPNGRWLVRVRCGYRRDGSPREVSETVDTEDEADRRIAEIASEMGRSGNVGDPMTLAEYYETRFVPDREGVLANASMNRYEGDWRRHIGPALGSRDMADISPDDIRRLIAGMSHAGAKHVVTTLRAILRSAWDDGYLDEEPMRHRVRYPPDRREMLPVWSAEDVARALEVMRGHPLEATWLVMVGGGLRREEAVALWWSDVTVTPMVTGSKVARVLVDDAVTPDDGRKPTKTRRSTRMVDIAEPFASRLAEIAGAPDEPVCPLSVHTVANSWRAMWQPRKVSTDGNGRYFRGIMLEAGIPYVPLSRMRATHETLAQAGGVADTLNAAVHGRTNVQVGYQHYLVPPSSSTMKVAEAVGDAVRLAR